jgi:alpha-ketoglutarate-dependent taurine dioxygenase
MSNFVSQKPDFNSRRRKAVGASQKDWVKIIESPFGKTLPLMMRSTLTEVDLVAWAGDNRDLIVANLLKYGGILFKDFTVKSVSEFERFCTGCSGELLEYTYRSTPRKRESGNIYTSTEYPADQSILLHNEMAYTSNWPMKIWFFCVAAAEQGGETPIADSRSVFNRINPKIRERFMQKQVMYVRNYTNKLDLPWQEVFQTTNKAEVENFCRGADIEFEWKSADHLRTSQICQAVATHPKTGEIVWFNQAHLFHILSLPSDVQASLLSVCSEQELPRNAYYGDGSPIESSVLDEIRSAYEQETVLFPWQIGDILMLDNMLAAHGRSPFSGTRKVLVAMAESFDSRSS